MQTPTLAIEIVREFVAKMDVDYASALARASEMAFALNPRAAAEQKKLRQMLGKDRRRESFARHARVR